jgi:hypothetical protein
MASLCKLLSAFFLASLVVFCSSVFAQVFKCVDKATGKTTFTDTACPDKGTGNYVPVKPSNSDSGYPSEGELAERKYRDEQVMRARHAEWDQQAAHQDQEEQAAAHEKRAKRLSNEAELAKNPWEKSLRMKHAQMERDAARGVSGSPTLKEPAAPSTAVPMAVPPPPVITNCDSSGCWDTVGNRYNKAAGETYFRSDGKACQGIGGNMQCN